MSDSAIPLDQQSCEACRVGAPLLSEAEYLVLKEQVPEWQRRKIEAVDQIWRRFAFKDFRSAIHFANEVAELAERQGHHPQLLVEWGGVEVSWWTHKIAGLHRNDMIMAAQTDALFGACVDDPLA